MNWSNWMSAWAPVLSGNSIELKAVASPLIKYKIEDKKKYMTEEANSNSNRIQHKHYNFNVTNMVSLYITY